MTAVKSKSSSRLERFKQIIQPFQGDSSSSGECVRISQEFEDFERRFNYIESCYAQAYERVQKLEIQIEEGLNERQKST